MTRSLLSLFFALVFTQKTFATPYWDEVAIDVKFQILDLVLAQNEKNDCALFFVSKRWHKDLGKNSALVISKLKRLTTKAQTFCPIQYTLDSGIYTQLDQDQFYGVLQMGINSLLNESAALSVLFKDLDPKLKACTSLTTRSNQLMDALSAVMDKKYYDTDSEDESTSQNLEHRAERLAQSNLMSFPYALRLFYTIHKTKKNELKPQESTQSKRRRVSSDCIHLHDAPTLFALLKPLRSDNRTEILRTICRSDSSLLDLTCCLTSNLKASQ